MWQISHTAWLKGNEAASAKEESLMFNLPTNIAAPCGHRHQREGYHQPSQSPGDGRVLKAKVPALTPRRKSTPTTANFNEPAIANAVMLAQCDSPNSSKPQPG
jgi:hypothetical protein